MGSVEVSLSKPDVVYAGTGSSKTRSNVSIGSGVYKSTDAGTRCEKNSTHGFASWTPS